MARWQPAMKDTLTALSTEITGLYGSGRVIIAVDGLDGAGQREFADALAEAITLTGRSVFRASIDDFHRSRAERFARGVDSPDGYYLDSFDYSTFRRVLLEPFRMGGSTAFVTAAFDYRRDAAIPSKWRSGPKDAILIIDGVFLNRPELRGLWNYSIWLDVPEELAAERVVARDGLETIAPRHVGGQKLYLAESSPRTTAVAIIDNRELDHPRRVFADSC